MEYLGTIAALLLLFAMIFFKLVYKQVRMNKKNESISKQDIVNTYESEMRTLLLHKNKEELSEHKILLLKKISSELHRNIFFDEKEAKEIVKYLASL